MSSYIHFIRHGITEGIVNKWYYGSVDLPLIEEGYEALREFMDQGIYPPLGDADCYTSGMLRANQTLQTLYGDVPFKAIPLLREMNFGNWECKTFEELQSEPEYEEWINNTEDWLEKLNRRNRACSRESANGLGREIGLGAAFGNSILAFEQVLCTEAPIEELVLGPEIGP